MSTLCLPEVPTEPHTYGNAIISHIAAFGTYIGVRQLDFLAAGAAPGLRALGRCYMYMMVCTENVAMKTKFHQIDLGRPDPFQAIPFLKLTTSCSAFHLETCPDPGLNC